LAASFAEKKGGGGETSLAETKSIHFLSIVRLTNANEGQKVVAVVMYI